VDRPPPTLISAAGSLPATHGQRWREVNHNNKQLDKRRTRIDQKSIIIWAPRIISKSQKFCRHEEAAKEAAEKKNAISTIDKIA
jgi:hypothetical protein